MNWPEAVLLIAAGVIGVVLLILFVIAAVILKVVNKL